MSNWSVYDIIPLINFFVTISILDEFVVEAQYVNVFKTNILPETDKVLELFMDLGANDEQLDFPVVYASAKNGIAKMHLEDESDNISCIFDTPYQYSSGSSLS